MKYSIKIRSPRTIYLFQFVVWAHARRDKYYLDSETHYKPCGGIPKPPHYEIQIIIPNERNILLHKLYAERSRRNNALLFINWPASIGSLGVAFEVISIWSLGSAAMMELPFNFNLIWTECGHKPIEFIKVMEKRFGYRIVQQPTLMAP